MTVTMRQDRDGHAVRTAGESVYAGRAVPAPDSRRFELDTGLTYHALEWGGDDPSLDTTVVLVHGFLDNAWGWRSVVEHGFEGRFHVVAPDMRGHGESDRVGAGGYYHFFDYLADLTSLIKTVRRQRLAVVGHSMGGSIAGYYAGAFPDQVDRLALLEGTGPPESDQPVPDRLVTWMSSWRRALGRGQTLYASLEEAAERLKRNDALLTDELAIELAGRGTTRTAEGKYRFNHDPVHLSMGPYPYRVEVAQQFWSRITCPVLLVEGGESAFRHAGAERERRYGTFANRRIEVIDGAGHMMQRHQPQALARALVEFLS